MEMSRKNIMADFVKSATKSGIIDTSRTDFMQNTGIDLLDFVNGTQDPETSLLHTGLAYGRVSLFAGKTSCGKTSAAITVAKNMTWNVDGSQIYHLDLERSTKPIRIKALTGLTEAQLFNDGYYNLIQRDLYTETLHSLIDSLYNFKKDHKDELMIEMEDSSGKVQKIYPPTVIILDSLAMLTSKKNIENDEISGNMSGSANALMNNKMFTQNVGKLEETNIHLFIINHINDGINIGIVPRSADMQYLGQNETLKGGKTSVYVSDILLKFVATSTKFGGEKDNKYGENIQGFAIKVQVIKSRNTTAGISFELIYDQVMGINNELSNLEAFINYGIIEGKSSFTFSDNPDIKFTRKNFLDKLRDNPSLVDSYDVARFKLRELLVNRVGNFGVEDVNVIENVVSVEQEVKSTRKRKSVVEAEETTQEEILE
jgi:RecA/RadA recombinase